MKTHTLTIPGYTIAYKTAGDPKHPPLFALHGWLDNANSFDRLAALLEDRFYFIALDLPGHGHSSHLPPGCYYHVTDALLIIMQILDALGLQKIHLLGHSMGACLASLLAGLEPARFASLFLIEGLGPFSSPAETACQQMSDYFLASRVKKGRKHKGYKHVDAAAEARAAKGYVSFDIAKVLCERGLEEREGTYYWRHDARLLVASPLRLTEGQILSFLKAVTAKSTLLLASEGFSFDTPLLQARIQAVKNLTIERLTGGHHIHMEQPEAVAAFIRSSF
jgi:pimeloyl-ACP methyl ester carboxylesterase